MNLKSIVARHKVASSVALTFVLYVIFVAYFIKNGFYYSVTGLVITRFTNFYLFFLCIFFLITAVVGVSKRLLARGVAENIQRAHKLVFRGVIGLTAVIVLYVIASVVIQNFYFQIECLSSKNCSVTKKRWSADEALRAALYNNDPRLCDRINDISYPHDLQPLMEPTPDGCKLMYAIKKQAVDYCLSLPPATQIIDYWTLRDSCLKRLARDLGRPDLCYKMDIIKNPGRGKSELWECYELAKSKGSSTYVPLENQPFVHFSPMYYAPAGYPFLLKWPSAQEVERFKTFIEKELAYTPRSEVHGVVDKVKAEQIAKNWLVKHGDIIGVTDGSQPVIRDSSCDGGWCAIWFSEQNIAGLPVVCKDHNCNIFMEVNFNGDVTRFEGKWFRSIALPKEFRISEADIKKQLAVSGFSPRSLKKVIYVYRNGLGPPGTEASLGTGLEFRLAWGIEIGQIGDFNSPILFHGYIDGVTGETIRDFKIGNQYQD